MNIDDIARICHDANASLCRSHGDDSQLPWDDAPEWQRASAIAGVHFHIGNPAASASASHDAWMADKIAAGWKHGSVKDVDKKEHPCIVPFGQLPPHQQAKDRLFKAIVHALS